MITAYQRRQPLQQSFFSFHSLTYSGHLSNSATYQANLIHISNTAQPRISNISATSFQSHLRNIPAAYELAAKLDKIYPFNYYTSFKSQSILNSQIYIASQERNFILVLTLLMIFNISKFQYQNPHSSNPICHSIPKPQHTDPTHYTSTFELLVTLFHQKCRFTFSHIIPKKLQAALPPLSIESVNY